MRKVGKKLLRDLFGVIYKKWGVISIHLVNIAVVRE
jgi:hypothetical protein